MRSLFFFFFSSRRRHTILQGDWSSDVCSSDLLQELKANPKRAAVGTIVEAQLDKNRGAIATAIVQTGTLHVGDVIVVGETFGKVRALEDEGGKRVTKAGPSTPVVVLGLSAVP